MHKSGACKANSATGALAQYALRFGHIQSFWSTHASLGRMNLKRGLTVESGTHGDGEAPQDASPGRIEEKRLTCGATSGRWESPQRTQGAAGT